MKNNSYVIFMICFFLMFFKLISASQEISLADIYKLTFEKDSFQSISKSTIDIEKNKIMQTVGLYKPQLKLEHLTSKRGGDYEFEPVVRYGNFEVPVDINIFRTYETKLVLNQLLYDHNRIKYARKIGETEIYVRTWELKKYFYEELRQNIFLYFGIISSVNKIKLLEESLVLLQKAVSIGEVQLNNGLITEVDLRLIINRKNEQVLMISEENKNLENLKTILAKRLHISNIDLTGPGIGVVPLQDLSFYLGHLNDNCEYNIQELRVSQSKDFSERIKADRGPYLSFYTQYGLRSDELLSTESGWIIGLTLSQDIFNGSIKKKKQEEALSQIRLQEDLLKEIREKNEMLLREQFRRASETYSRLSIIEERVNIYRDKVEIDRQRLEQGNISEIEFLRTVTEFNSQQIEYELRKIDYIKNYYELVFLCGLAEEFIRGGDFEKDNN